MPAVLKKQFMPQSLFLLVLTVLTSLYHPTPGYGATKQDVLDYLASNPAPAGCTNYTLSYTENGLQGVKIMQRCNGANVTATVEGIYTSGPSGTCQSFCYLFTCDGANGQMLGTKGTTFYSYTQANSRTTRCDGTIVDQYGSTVGATGTGLPCLWTTQTVSTCSNLDTQLASFFPVDDPCQTTGNCEPCKTCPCNNTNGASSISLRSGNFQHEQDLITKPASLAFKLLFNNQASFGPLGIGWTHNYDKRISASTNGTLSFWPGDGNRISFTLSGSSTYYPNTTSGDTSTIVKNANNTFTRTMKDGNIQTFDTLGRLSSLKDRNNNTTTLTYSDNTQNGTLKKITDSTGRSIIITTVLGKITSISGLAQTYTLTYTGRYLTGVADQAGNTWSYTYLAGQMLSKTDPMGFTTTYTLDSFYRLATATDPNGRVKVMSSYDTGNSTTQFVEKDGGLWTHQYDSNLNKPITKTDPQGNVTTHTYDANGNLLTLTEPGGSTTTYTYDANRNVTSVTDALGHTTGYTYNGFGQVTSITDPRGHVFTYAYDAKGNLTSFTDALGAVTRYAYDTKGNRISTTDALNRVTTFTYDAYNNVATITDPKNAVTKFYYDINGNMTIQTDANNFTTTFAYNNLNQLTQITDPYSNITTFTYDRNGNRASMTDANGKTTTYAYNYKGELLQTTDALGGITSFAYGETGCSNCGGGTDKLTALVDARGNATAFAYNTLGRLITETDPLGKVTSYGYDAKGNLTSKTDANNNTITYSYDNAGRLLSKTYPNSTTARFTYDANGNVLTASNANISYTFTYDNNNRVLSVTDSNNKTISYAYNALGNRTQMTYPDTSTAVYTYDTSNRLSSIISGGSYTFTYDSLDRRTRLTYPSQAYSTYTYDNNSRLTGLTNRQGTFTYQYDKIINRTSLTEPQGTHGYTYDNIYQLKTATHNTQPNESYTYDLTGNRTTATVNGANQIISDATYTYSYDNNGNLISRTTTTTGETRTFTWNYENQLIAVTGTGLTVQYTYDPFGRRIQKNVNGTITNYVYDGQNVIAEYDQNNQMTTKYVQGPGIDEHLAMQRSGSIYYYHTDGLGSVAAITNQSGTVVQSYKYDSFGNIVSQTGSIQQPYTYTGREYDSETGLYYYRARYYDTITGRFISKDPIGFLGGLNLYAYVGNNPVNFTDPKGLFTYHGNWCGPNWTGGKKEQFNGNNYDQYKPATDGLDSACQKHDICYARCRTMYPCDKAARGSCMTACDRTLAKDAEVYAQYTSPLWLWMNYNNSPDPGQNDCSCKK